MKKASIPLGIFAVLLVFLVKGLFHDPHLLPSPLMDKPVPDFVASILHQPTRKLTPKDMLGNVWLLNAWASWCVTCREEHTVLLEFAKSKTIPIVGLDYRDKEEDGKYLLMRFGNPYDVTVSDRDGKMGIDFGIYGVPESFLIDKAGIIRYKHVGPLTLEVLRNHILPMIHQLQK